MSQWAIRAEGLGKCFRSGGAHPARGMHEIVERFAKRMLGRVQSSVPANGHFWALRDVSFEVGRGEALAVLGANGAGKSVLLKLLSRVTAPTAGWAELSGSVGSLLEVGTGFHPELSGRDNVYFNGAILGMTRAQIRRQFDEIVAFSGIEPFIDTPVKLYSSGMRIRLAFSVAVHLEPDILLIDEALAVGDAPFRAKCRRRIATFIAHGCTLLLVSHDPEAVTELCQQAILLEGGRLTACGDVREVLNRYQTRPSQSLHP